jgi:acyl-CoA reductase-like NAD-dependent aldehyde dehydrogenase
LVKKDVYKQVVNAIIGKVRELSAGNPMSEDTYIGPVISESESIRIEAWVKAAVSSGAHRLIGGDRQGSLYPPTVLENIPFGSKVWSEEIFGPVMCVTPYNDFHSAIDLVNKSKFGIHAGIFTDDIHQIMYAWSKLEVGGVIVNDVPTIRLDAMPYGGVKDSGNGREGIKYAIEEMTEIRALLFREV